MENKNEYVSYVEFDPQNNDQSSKKLEYYDLFKTCSYEIVESNENYQIGEYSHYAQ